MSIQQYSNSRPFAMLEVNHQIQHEFYGTLFPPNHPVNSGLPFGLLFVVSKQKFKCRPILLGEEVLDIYVTAMVQNDESNRIGLFIGFSVPRTLRITGKTRDLIEETLTGYFDTENKFTLPHFLIAVDRVLTLDLSLDWEESLRGTDPSGRTIEDLIGRYKKFFFCSDGDEKG